MARTINAPAETTAYTQLRSSSESNQVLTDALSIVENHQPFRADSEVQHLIPDVTAQGRIDGKNVADRVMKLAYADPPYIGQAKRHYRCAEVDHEALIHRLETEFPDGWALSGTTTSLLELLSMCRNSKIRVMAWVKQWVFFKPNIDPAYAWEPVLVWGGRKFGRSVPTVRDWVCASATHGRGTHGAKPRKFCLWLFRVLGLLPTDEFHDLFPGSGAVTDAWEEYKRHDLQWLVETLKYLDSPRRRGHEHSRVAASLPVPMTKRGTKSNNSESGTYRMQKPTTSMNTKIETTNLISLCVDDIEFIKELYPRFREDDAAVERYRAAIDRLPPITVARGRILVDGFHRWQAYRRENVQTVQAEDLGNLSDIEILKEAIRRNACHGRQLETSDKKRNADHLYRVLVGGQDDRYREIAELLSITAETAKKYCEEARRDEKQTQQAKAWDLWLDCCSERDIALKTGVPQQTINGWLTEKRKDSEFGQALESLQHLDIWTFAKTGSESGYFGKMQPQIVENLLWLYTEPGQIIFDAFAGAGTTIEVAKRMGRRVWASDLKPSTPTLPIHEHDITKGWPKAAPTRVDFILLNTPYCQQSKGKHSDTTPDLRTDRDQFMNSWRAIVQTCKSHLANDGCLAFRVNPIQAADDAVDLIVEMWRACVDTGLKTAQRIVVYYQTEHATEEQLEWARRERKLLKVCSDLVIMRPK